MKLLRTVREYPEFKKGSVAAIGNFDGVHLGHRYLLDILRSRANDMRLPMVVIMFEPQAREFFLKQAAPPRLSRFREKVQLLEKCGVEYILCLRFNQKLANMHPVEFAEKVIFCGLNVKYLLVGEDFKFGRDRLGDYNLLKELSIISNCEVEKCTDYLIGEERISSTIVRQALSSANFKKVKNLLGRNYSIAGKVIYGDAKGRELGFPTANISIGQSKPPLSGVFCVQVVMSNGACLLGVANLGKRPTMDGVKQLLEVHILDFNEILYGQTIKVFFMHKLRDEKKFLSVDELRSQIKQDIYKAREFFRVMSHD